MALFFNGRKFVSPTVVSRIDDSRMFNRGLSVGNVLALIGNSSGGAAKTVYRFGNPAEARETLESGELLKAIEMAFDPSSQTGAPQSIVALKPAPATKATLALLDSASGTALTLSSVSAGEAQNRINVKIEAGTTAGRKVTIVNGDDVIVQDNISANLMTVRYTGAAETATMSISRTAVTLVSGAQTDTLTITNSTPVTTIVAWIDAKANWTATATAAGKVRRALFLDNVTSADCKTANYTAVGVLQPVVDFLNEKGVWVTAVRGTSAGLPPAAIDYTYLSGGTDGSPSTQDWQDCFDLLQTEDVQWIVPLTSTPAVHAMADTHCSFMASIGQKERRCFVGGALGQTDDQAIAASESLGSLDRTGMVHPGVYAYDRFGALTLYAPYMAAAMVAGGFAGTNPGTAMTNKVLKINGVERKLRNPTDTDRLIEGGIIPIEATQDGYKVVRSVSMWKTDANYNRIEISCGTAADFVARNVREAVQPLIGEKATPQLLTRAEQIVESTLRELARPEPTGPGIIVGDAEHPAYRSITASIEGDVLRVSFECSPVIPINYIPITIFAVPYTGTVTV